MLCFLLLCVCKRLRFQCCRRGLHFWTTNVWFWMWITVCWSKESQLLHKIKSSRMVCAYSLLCPPLIIYPHHMLPLIYLYNIILFLFQLSSTPYTHLCINYKLYMVMIHGSPIYSNIVFLKKNYFSTFLMVLIVRGFKTDYVMWVSSKVSHYGVS